MPTLVKKKEGEEGESDFSKYFLFKKYGLFQENIGVQIELRPL